MFSGGSVTSAGVGRTDLISEKDTPVLTKHQFESKNLFLTFDDNVHILPTHGQGSFCSVSSKPLPDYPTIESLKIDNTLLTVESMKEFERQLSRIEYRYWDETDNTAYDQFLRTQDS